MKAKELAGMLQMSDKTLRAWLRVNLTRLPEDKGRAWSLNDKQIIAIEHFANLEIKTISTPPSISRMITIFSKDNHD